MGASSSLKALSAASAAMSVATLQRGLSSSTITRRCVLATEKNGFLVQWGKCARINNLCRNTVSLQRICRRECLVNHARDCHNRDVRALALNVGFAQGNYILALWYLTAHSIE